MGKASKSTKKFQKKHLKGAIEQRKKVQQYKQKMGDKKKRKDAVVAAANDNSKVFEDMDVEKYFEKPAEVKMENKKKGKKVAKKAAESDSEDSDEDEEELEMDPQDLKDLEKDDPEFYKYLQKNDKGLLDFEAVNPLDAMDSDSEDEDDDEGEDKLTQVTKVLGPIEVSLDLVKKWEKNLKADKPSVKGIRNMLNAFKAAVHADSDEEYRYKVTSEQVFNYLLIMALKQMPVALQKVVPYKVNGRGVRSLPSGHKKEVANISRALKSFVPSLLELIDGVTSTETAALVLRCIQELMPYFISWRKSLKQLITAIVNLWSTTTEIETQIACFAFMNNVAKEYPNALLEMTLRTAYSTFIKNCRRTNVHTMPLLNFQKNSMGELFQEDPQLGYDIGFESIRQLAIHLRNSVNNPTKESYKSVYNWQYVHSLDFWSRVLSAVGTDESPLRQLIYPLVQVTIGTIRLIPSPQFFPLRFYLIRSLIRLSQQTGVFIPLFPLLSETLTSTAFTKKPHKANVQAFDFDNSIKASKEYLGTRAYQEGLSEEFTELAAEFFALYSKSIAFPELVTPATIYLRRYMKRSKNAKFNRLLSSLVEKLNANAKYIEQKRQDIEYGPSNKQEVAKFLQDVEWNKTPLGAYVKMQREVKEAKQKVLRESLEEAEREEAEKKASEKESDEIEIDEEGEEEEEESEDE